MSASYVEDANDHKAPRWARNLLNMLRASIIDNVETSLRATRDRRVVRILTVAVVMIQRPQLDKTWGYG